MSSLTRVFQLKAMRNRSEKHPPTGRNAEKLPGLNPKTLRSRGVAFSASASDAGDDLELPRQYQQQQQFHPIMEKSRNVLATETEI